MSVFLICKNFIYPQCVHISNNNILRRLRNKIDYEKNYKVLSAQFAMQFSLSEILPAMKEMLHVSH